MAEFYRLDGTVQDPTGLAQPGASVAVLTQPASFATQPGSPLASIYAANASNSATITAASWAGGQITFTFSTTPPADVLPGTYIAVSGVTPSAFNTTLEEPYLVVSVTGNNVVVVELTSPGTYVSGGTVATSVLPNPTETDNNGNWFFYAAAGIYSVQIYSPTLTERDLPDQGVGTVAGGSVLSVGLSLPAIFTVSGSPVTTSGTLTAALATQAANTVLAGPTTGSAATPAFRALVAADFPSGVGSVTSVGHTLTMPGIFSVSTTGSPVTTTGTLADTVTLATQSANTVWAGPSSGSASAPAFRALVVADIPLSGYGSLSAGILIGGLQETVQIASGSTDALTFPGACFITTAGVDAMTLATPANPGDNGKRVRVTDTSGHDHTITASSNKIAPSHSTLTFGGTIGNFVELEAFGGLWFVGASAGVTPS